MKRYKQSRRQFDIRLSRMPIEFKVHIPNQNMIHFLPLLRCFFKLDIHFLPSHNPIQARLHNECVQLKERLRAPESNIELDVLNLNLTVTGKETCPFYKNEASVHD